MKVIREIGKGNTCTVNLCETEFGLAAVKVVSKAFLEENDYLQEYFESQLKLMQLIKHTNIVSFLKYQQDGQNHYIFMEYCQLGSLPVFINNRKQTFLNPAEGFDLFVQMGKAVEAVHLKSYLHRDIRPDNILVTRKSGKIQFKICDFGFSKQARRTNTLLGMPVFLAPQVICSEQYGEEMDIWAIGVTLFWAMLGQYPFQSKKLKKSILAKCQPQFRFCFEAMNCANYRQELKHSDIDFLFKRLFEINPKKRLTISQARKLEFLRDYFLQSEKQQATIRAEVHLKKLAAKNKEVQQIQEEEQVQSSILLGARRKFREWQNYQSQKISFIKENNLKIEQFLSTVKKVSVEDISALRYFNALQALSVLDDVLAAVRTGKAFGNFALLANRQESIKYQKEGHFKSWQRGILGQRQSLIYQLNDSIDNLSQEQKQAYKVGEWQTASSVSFQKIKLLFRKFYKRIFQVYKKYCRIEVSFRIILNYTFRKIFDTHECGQGLEALIGSTCDFQLLKSKILQCDKDKIVEVSKNLLATHFSQEQ